MVLTRDALGSGPIPACHPDCVPRLALLIGLLVVAAAVAGFALLGGGDDPPDFGPALVEDDPFAWAPGRDEEFEARAAAATCSTPTALGRGRQRAAGGAPPPPDRANGCRRSGAGPARGNGLPRDRGARRPWRAATSREPAYSDPGGHRHQPLCVDVEASERLTAPCGARSDANGSLTRSGRGRAVGHRRALRLDQSPRRRGPLPGDGPRALRPAGPRRVSAQMGMGTWSRCSTPTVRAT